MQQQLLLSVESAAEGREEEERERERRRGGERDEGREKRKRENERARDGKKEKREEKKPAAQRGARARRAPSGQVGTWERTKEGKEKNELRFKKERERGRE